MQSILNNLIEKNKRIYENLHNKISNLTAQSENDFQNLLCINNKLPEKLCDGDCIELRKLLNSVEIQMRYYENETDNIERELSEMDNSTSSVINSAGILKGNILLTKNTLVSQFVEYASNIQEGVKTIRNILLRLNKMVFDFKNLTGINDYDKENLKNVIKDIIDENKNLFKCDCDKKISNIEYNINEMTSLIEEFNKKIMYHENIIDSVKEFVGDIEKKIKDDVKELSNNLDLCKNGTDCYKREINNTVNKMDNDVFSVRSDLNNRLKALESLIDNNVIKRYTK